jgi:NAD(P)-dependent dehydrogenase (short-subunit alcohol dehydrogenase family)
LFDLGKKICVVTGGTKGIGRTTAERMIEHGAQVALTSRFADDAKKRARELNDKYGEDRAYGVPFDLADRNQGRELIDKVVQKWGRIDTLMCNAAHILLGRLETLGDDMDAVDRSFQANVRNYAALTRHVVPIMREQGGGTVIYVLSTAAFIAAPPYLPYGIAKVSLDYMTRSLAVDFGPDNIRVNAIVPGSIRTNRETALEKSGSHGLFVAKIPLARRGDPDDMAGVAILLSSPGGAYITGQTIAVDGGMLLKGSEGITEGYDHAVTHANAMGNSMPVSDE